MLYTCILTLLSDLCILLISGASLALSCLSTSNMSSAVKYLFLLYDTEVLLEENWSSLFSLLTPLLYPLLLGITTSSCETSCCKRQRG